MNKFQAAFEVLYFLSAIDGEVSKSEIDVILDFLKSNNGNIDFEPGQVIDSISILKADGLMDELKLAALTVKETSSAKDRMVILDFAFELIVADGKLAPAERDLFIKLGNTWDIDIQKYVASKQ